MERLRSGHCDCLLSCNWVPCPGYNEHFHGPVVLSSARVGAVEAHRAHKSNFLHPYIAYFPANDAWRHFLSSLFFSIPSGPSFKSLPWSDVGLVCKDSQGFQACQGALAARGCTYSVAFVRDIRGLLFIALLLC